MQAIAIACYGVLYVFTVNLLLYALMSCLYTHHSKQEKQPIAIKEFSSNDEGNCDLKLLTLDLRKWSLIMVY